MSSFKTITLEQHHPISTLSLNRPDVHNAFNPLMINELKQALEIVAEDAKVRVLLLSANGKHFCAGADLHWMQAMAKSPQAENNADALVLAQLFQQLADLNKPSIALTHGRIMGGGCGLIACCDLVIASQNSCFCFSEVKIGLIPATIAPYIIRRIGYQAARRYFITAELIESDVAATIQLVDHIVSYDVLQKTGRAIAQQICQNSPQAITEVKKLLNKLVPVDVCTLEASANQLAEIRLSADAKEGLSAFLEKRPPQWIANNKSEK